MWGRQLNAFEHLLILVVEEPVLPRFEARNHRMSRGGRVFRGVLAGRTVATADVTTLGASAEVKPPTARAQTLNTTVSRGFFDAGLIPRLSFFMAAFSELLSPKRARPYYLPSLGEPPWGRLELALNDVLTPREYSFCLRSSLSALQKRSQVRSFRPYITDNKGTTSYDLIHAFTPV